MVLRVRSHVYTGMLHTGLAEPRNKTFICALAMRAILWATPLARASMAAQAALTETLATLWRVFRSLVCVTAPTRTAELSRTKVSAESAHQRTSTAQKVADLPARARDPTRISIRSGHASDAFCRPDSAPIGLQTSSSTRASSTAFSADSPAVENVGYVMVRVS